MENLDGDDVFKARRVVGQRDTNPPPEPVAIPPGDDLIETELGLRPRAEWEIILSARRAHHGVKELARTDYMVTKAMETGRKLSSEWTSWRQHLRDVVNGNGEDVRPEPARWAVVEMEQPEAPLLPAPDALMSDYGPVDPKDAETIIDGFAGELRTSRDTAEGTMRSMDPPDRRRLFSILNTELGRLKNQEALLGKSIPRRADVEELIGILAKVGEA